MTSVSQIPGFALCIIEEFKVGIATQICKINMIQQVVQLLDVAHFLLLKAQAKSSVMAELIFRPIKSKQHWLAQKVGSTSDQLQLLNIIILLQEKEGYSDQCDASSRNTRISNLYRQPQNLNLNKHLSYDLQSLEMKILQVIEVFKWTTGQHNLFQVSVFHFKPHNISPSPCALIAIKMNPTLRSNNQTMESLR